MYADLPRPTLFAHRGSSAHAPENTLAAFELAVQQGAPAMELDATLCGDRQVVVIHDDTLLRTTATPGIVRKMPLKAIQELDAGSWFDPAFKGEKIPTLAQVFETVGKRIFINVEIKNYASPLDDLPDHLASLVVKHGMIDRVLFSSFNPIALLRVGKLLPQVPRGLLVFRGKQGAWARGWFGDRFPCQALHPEASDVSASLISKVHQANRRIHVYTVNQPDEMTRLYILGVDGIFTDDPPLAQHVLARSQA
jgi:glycerophosphoryl diester phosphodiesterase